MNTTNTKETSITIVEDTCIGFGEDIDTVIQDYKNQGFSIKSTQNHPAVGRIVTLVK